MSTVSTEVHMIKGPPLKQFARFVLPSVVGMLAYSTAGVVDGIFVGKFVGTDALASVNLTMPLMTLVYGVLFMLATGASVIAGEFIGQGQIDKASDIFVKTGIVMIGLMCVLTPITLLFATPFAMALGAQGETIAMSVEYMWVFAWFFPILSVAILLNQFVRVDGRPSLVFFGMIGITVTNIVLDFLLIGLLGWGLFGAALATGLAYLAGTIVMLFHFAGSQAKLQFLRPTGSWALLPRAVFNGFSEFLNETSAGLVMLLFNWILMSQAGASGVAAFSIVNYAMFVGVLLFYGVGDGIAPLISVNYGARKPRRLYRFLSLGIAFNLLGGVLIVAVLLIWSNEIVGVFLEPGEIDTRLLAVGIIGCIWPMFLFSGANIAFSAYFTGMQCAAQSAMIATARSLALPVGLILLFWKLFGLMGVFYALPVAEMLTFALSITLFRMRRPEKVIRRHVPATFVCASA